MAIVVTFFSESPGSACHKYRIMGPVNALSGHPTIRATYSPKWDVSVKSSDIMIFQRNSNHGAAKLISALSKDNRLLIYDMDDDLFQIPESNPVFNLYFNMEPENTDMAILARQVLGMRLATVVTVSSERLRDVCSAINPNVRILPNCVKLDEWCGKEPILDPTTDKIRIFWGGSPTHQQDLGLLQSVFSEIYRRYGNAIEIIIMGDDSVRFRAPVTYIPYGSYEFFQRIMLSCQIGLAPMKDDLFNRAKSDLRLKEMACANLAVVASPVGEYKKASDFAFLCSETEDWIASLSTLIEDEKRRKELSKASRKWVENWDIGKQIHLWEELIEEVYTSGNNRRSTGKTFRVQDTEYTAYVPGGSKVRVG